MRLSIIIPVYREEKNIKKTLEKISKSVRTPHEILIIYHYKNDPTLVVIRDYMHHFKNQSLRLIQNKDESRNRVMNSIKIGFSKSRGEAVVVLMADLSDDISQIDRMYSLFKKGHHIVCASRYMKGGRKIGGPIIKTLLSKFACITLFYLFHIPTHDATNAFKLYDRSMFKKITIESTGGFEYSLEIILKAYNLGFSIVEIPTIWKDRVAGSSNFKILAWLPSYLKWYSKSFQFFLKK